MSNETLILKSAVATNSDIAITDLPFANVDALEGAKHFQNESFEGVKTFKSAKTGATAFGTATVKGDEVPIVIGSSEIYDEQFKYGIYADGQIKTADEIFAPDQNGNYDISDYPAIPATTLLERLETFPTGTNNTIRINPKTAEKYVEGFIIHDVEWLPSLQNTKYQYYTTGSFIVGDAFTETITDSASFKGGKVEMLPGDSIVIKGAGGNAPRKYCVVIGGIVDAIAPANDSAIFTYTATQQCVIYFAVSIASAYEVSVTLTKKLDYVVAQANAKGYDVTVANNESDIKLIEKVEFDGTNYVDSGLKVNSDTRPIKIDLTTQAKENKNQYIFGYRSVTNADYRRLGLYVSSKDSSNNGNIIYSNGTAGSVLVPANISSTLGSFLNKTRKQILIQTDRKVYVNGIEVRTFSEQTYTAINTAPIGQGRADDTGLINRITDINIDYYSCLIADNLFIPANNGTTDGMINLKDMSFHPLTDI